MSMLPPSVLSQNWEQQQHSEDQDANLLDIKATRKVPDWERRAFPQTLPKASILQVWHLSGAIQAEPGEHCLFITFAVEDDFNRCLGNHR